ncbi:MAG TPA: DUF3341 domain-containing protein, partial [Anaerolineae bacterium]|nr:DUF3341 domain-containing protein [Anaerolineae bacterium]
ARPRPRERLTLITAIGAAVGFLIGVFLMVGTTNLYPLDVGGQPLVPGPPSIVMIYEYTLLGALSFLFFGFLLNIRTPAYWRPVYDRRLTEDAFGLLVAVTSRQLAPAEAALRANGGFGVRRLDEAGFFHRLRWWLGGQVSTGMWVGLVAGAVLGIAVLCAFAYSALQWIYPDQMVTQQSVGHQEGPRLTAPTAAVPIQGPVLIAGQPATEPLPASAASRERGAILFRTHCYLCHGNEGQGNGPLAGYYAPPPANFRGPVVPSLPPSEVFRVITLGRGVMPSLAEGLTAGETWDLVTLVKGPLPSPTAVP